VAELTLSGLTIQSDGVTLVDQVGLTVRPGEIVALIGASGSGKTLTCRALLGLVDLDPGVVSANLHVADADHEWTPYAGLSGAGRRARDRAFRSLRGRILGYLPQGAPAALDPVVRVGTQLQRTAELGQGGMVTSWLERAGFDAEQARALPQLWPHELSGGMAQRVVIAQALARGSRILVADEPTTGLDAPLQRRLLESLRALADDGLAVLIVTHDLRMASPVADRMIVLDGGRTAEVWSGVPEVAESPAGARLLSAIREVPW